jgi:hypothetical protein
LGEQDRRLLIIFLKARVKPEDLETCFSFIHIRGNLPNDYKAVLAIYNSKKYDWNEVFNFVFEHIKEPSHIHLAVSIAKIAYYDDDLTTTLTSGRLEETLKK